MPTCVRPIVYLVLWGGLISLGLAALQVHQRTPGTPGTPPRDWPSQSGLRRDPGRPTLVIAAHPQCPCTEATLGELARILAEVDGKLTVHILFLKPSGSGVDWSDTRNVRAAKALQGVQAAEDESGAKARLFGATTSGLALYYDVQGCFDSAAGLPGHAGTPGTTRADRGPGEGRQRGPGAHTRLRMLFAAARHHSRRHSMTQSGPEIGAPTTADISGRARELLGQHLDAIARRADRLFAGLMVLEWLAGIVIALYVSPKQWSGTASTVHIHVWAALILGAVIVSVPVYVGICQPSRTSTRHIIAVGQMAMGGLLIHLSGGRIETHFHVFGSLAFLAVYRDWRVMVTGAAVVVVDHAARGMFFPYSLYGVGQPVAHPGARGLGRVRRGLPDLFLRAGQTRPD